MGVIMLKKIFMYIFLSIFFDGVVFGLLDSLINSQDAFSIDTEMPNTGSRNSDYNDIFSTSDNASSNYNGSSQLEVVSSKLDNQFLNLKKYIDNKVYTEEMERKVWLANQKKILQAIISKLESRLDSVDINSKKILQGLASRFDGNLGLLQKYIEETNKRSKQERLEELTIQRESFNKQIQQLASKINDSQNNPKLTNEINAFSEKTTKKLKKIKNFINTKWSKDSSESVKFLGEQNKNFLDLETKLNAKIEEAIKNHQEVNLDLDLDKVSDTILKKIESKLKLNIKVDKDDLLNAFDSRLDFNLDKLKSYISQKNSTDEKERICWVAEQKNSITDLTKSIEEKLSSMKKKNKKDKEKILDNLNVKFQDNFEKLTKYVEERDDYLRLNRAIWIGEQQKEIEKLANEFYSISPFIKNGREKDGITNVFDYKLQLSINNVKDYIEEKMKKEKQERDLWINKQTEIMQKLAMEIKSQNNNKDFKKDLLGNIDKKLLTAVDGLKKDINEVKKDKTLMTEEVPNKLITMVELLDQKLSSTVEKIKDMVSEKMQSFDQKLQLAAQNMEKSFMEFQNKSTSNETLSSNVEDRIKLYFDSLNNNLTKKIEDFEHKLASAQSAVEDKLKMADKSEKLTKKSIDEKIKDIVQGELGSLKEERLKKFIKREKRKQKDKRVKLLKELIEKDVG
jgi:hypothetical protein